MDTTLNAFQRQQASALSVLEKLEAFLSQGKVLGLPVEPSLLTKLINAREHLTADKLKVALIGGFSEGKTSIASAWMGRFDEKAMMISEQESSKEVSVYDVDDGFVLIDTPGLFGFKERYGADGQAIEQYKDITRKYISEAHLVLYVMNSTNPIKESHEAELNWLFRTLGLLPRTVFVLSRFDEVADVEDENDYQENLRIKCLNVSKRLREVINASDEEITTLFVVAVAANPFDMGMTYWLNHPEEYRALSHIASLQEATAAKIELSGGPKSIVEQAQRSVILDVLDNVLPIAKQNDLLLEEEVRRLDYLAAALNQQMQEAGAQLMEVRENLKDFVADYFTGLLIQLESITTETFAEFYQQEIGEDGIQISIQLKNEFEHQFNEIMQEISRMRLSFKAEIVYFNDTIVKLSKQEQSIAPDNLIDASHLIAVNDDVSRDNRVVFDEAMAPQPWGSNALAEQLSDIMLQAGITHDLGDIVDTQQQQLALRKVSQGLSGWFKTLQKALVSFIDEAQFIDVLFPDYRLLQDNAAVVSDVYTQRQQAYQQVKQWHEQGELIAVEFAGLKD